MALELAAGRGEVDALTTLPQLKGWWTRDGLVAITSGAAAIELLGQRGDIDAAISAHDEVVASVAHMWLGESFHARIRLAALLIGHLASASATATAGEREKYVGRGDDLTGFAAKAKAGMRHTGPEGLAWANRVAAEHARLHWLANLDPPAEEQLIDSWRQAVSAFAAFGHRYETARSQTRLAAVLLAAGSTDEAGELVAQARETALALGARPLLDELRHLTGDNRPAERGARSREPETLTPRERDVLTLVATGRSNREIAQQLFISAKTVSVHISNVLAKLDASSRTEAVAIARRRSLID
jgi:DNA-binding NarL/FixJ family response regulator